MLVAVALGGLAQVVSGMGFALIAAPALIAMLGPRDGVSTVLFLAAIASLVPLLRGGWRHARLNDAGLLLLPVLVVTPLIALALEGADPDLLSIAAGACALAGVGLLAAGFRSEWLRRPGGAFAAGAASAAMNVVGGVGGPPVGIYAANAGWGPQTLRGTLQAFLLAQGVLTLVVLGVVLPGVDLLAALLAGIVAGMALAPRLPAGTTRAAILVLSALGGIALIAGSL